MENIARADAAAEMGLSDENRLHSSSLVTRMPPGKPHSYEHSGHVAVSARRAGGFEKGEYGHDPAIHLPFFD